MKSTFFITNNLGGGGTNVSRFIVYQDLFKDTSAGLLLNYYYLDNSFKKSMPFDQSTLAGIHDYTDIHQFLAAAADQFALEKGRLSNKYAYQTPQWKPVTLLDSGSGNILRDISQSLVGASNEQLQKIYAVHIKAYHAFAEKLGFDIAIGFDMPQKNTYKMAEGDNADYQAMRQRISADLSINHLLIETTLAIKPQFKHKIYVPIHGSSPESFVEYYLTVLEHEKAAGNRFDGLALGGLGRLKVAEILTSLRAAMLSSNDTRPVHILGSGGIQKLQEMVEAGGTSYDCHTPWRRASDGGRLAGSRSKILIPKLNSQLQNLGNDKPLTYIDMDKLKDTLGCDCPVCLQYPLAKIEEIYLGDTEDHYFAKLLIFAHAIWQYDFILQKYGDS